MNILLLIVGLAVILLGVTIWRFKLVYLLSNVDINRVEYSRHDELARYAGRFLIAIGSLFVLLSYLTGVFTTERQFIILLACLIPIIMTITVMYLAGLERFMKK